MDEETLAIEVGPRNNPSILDLPESLLQGNTIIYIDKRHDSGIYEALDRLKNKGKQLVVLGDAVHLPVSDNSSGTIYCRDMFGSEGTQPHVSTTGYLGGESERVGKVSEIAQEWFRVVRPGGKAIIAEWSTPDFAPFKKIDAAFKAAGFIRQEEDVYSRGEQILLNRDAAEFLEGIPREEIAKKFHATFAPESYTVIYTKPEE